MKGLLAAPVLALALGPLGAAHGQQLFKCVSPAGKTSYQEEPCQTTPGKEQPPGKAASGSPKASTPQMKAGWEPRELEAADSACAKPILDDSRKYFDMQSRSYPEAQIVPPVDRFCMCITRRIAATHTHDDYSKNPGALRDRIANAALKDGPCKPDGLLAEMWKKTGKMR